MNLQEIFQHLDSLFAVQDIAAVEPYLTKQLEYAFQQKEYDICIAIMNELIGFFRDTSEYEKSLDYAEQALSLIKELGYTDTLPYATTMLNVANALRAAGHLKESLAFYEQVYPIYQQHLKETDERFASYFNNLSLLYQEMGHYEMAVDCLNKAMAIIKSGDDMIKVAITHSNLGASLLQLGKVSDAVEHLQAALAIFNQSEEKDFHYNAAIAAMGQAYVAMNNFEAARACYLDALFEQKKHCGKSEAFYRILDNLHMIEERLGVAYTPEPDDSCNVLFEVPKETSQNAQIRGLDLAEHFYKHVAKNRLKTDFTAAFDRMAIGLAGEGSECFGFDDMFSADHDFGPGFCIWLSYEDYMQYGLQLKHFYESLPDTFMGYTRMNINGADRVGVWCIDDFFEKYTGYKEINELQDLSLLMSIPDEGIATVLNGRIFHDPSCFFTRRREELYNAFSDKIWHLKIAQALMELGKYGQYNYPRCMKRGDYVTAQMVLYKYIEVLLKFVHYINHAFPPYYKWLKKSAAGLHKLAVLADLTEALADFADGRVAWKEDPSGASDKIVGTIEIIAKLIIDECNAEGLFEGLNIPAEELFLEAYGKRLYQRILSTEDDLKNTSFSELVDYMVSMEWKAFDKVQNLDGRAECQDDWNTFSIMRKSQYLTWPRTLLESFIRDFHSANQQGQNLITFKYARMMESTDPIRYAQIQDKLPMLDPQQKKIIEQIVMIQVSWMEEFAVEYPHMAENARSIHTSEDTLYNTSYETYLRGELSTYSTQTLKLYGDFVVDLAKNGQNLAKMTMENTARLYGYESLETAERMLSEILTF